MSNGLKRSFYWGNMDSERPLNVELAAIKGENSVYYIPLTVGWPVRSEII